MEHKKHSLSYWVFIVLILIVAGVIYFLRNQEKWTLFVYSSNKPDKSQQVFRLPNIKSMEACFSQGYEYEKRLTENGSFECGLNCRFDQDFGEEICKEVCSTTGC